MEPRDLAKTMARGRIAAGAGLLLAPALTGRPWIGRDAGRAGTKVFTRAFGARDLGIGLGVVIALDRGTPVRGWLEASVLADATDLVATWLARDDLPRGAVPVVSLIAGGSALAGAWLARALDPAQDEMPGQTPEAALTGHPA